MRQALRDLLTSHWQHWLPPVLVLLITLAAGWLIRRFLFRALERHAASTKTQIDDILVHTLRGPFMIWMLILGVHLGVQSSRLPPAVLHLSARILLILWIISLTIASARLAGYLVRYYGGQLQSALPVTSLTENLARLLVATVGILILLNAVGVEITPILAGLGVGGLAVALALQNTLSNLFAGFYVSVAGQIRVGDYIKLNSGEEGFVTDITWRSTVIRALANNLIIVPNSKLAEAVVTNYHLPEKRMSLSIPVGVSYDSDPDHVERVLLEVAQSAAQEIPGLLAEPAPVVRFIPGFGDSSLNFTLICQVAEFTDQYVVQHELRKRILKQFRQEGIEIPYPMRTIQIRRAGGAERAGAGGKGAP
jgi:small-conductance mechanosensitive channel